MSETVPLFACKGEKIVEVAFIDAEEVLPGRWEMVKEISFDVEEDIDRLVVEHPIGCFEQDFDALGGNKITLLPGGRFQMHRCTQPPTFADAAEEVKARLV